MQNLAKALKESLAELGPETQPGMIAGVVSTVSDDHAAQKLGSETIQGTSRHVSRSGRNPKFLVKKSSLLNSLLATFSNSSGSLPVHCIKIRQIMLG